MPTVPQARGQASSDSPQPTQADLLIAAASRAEFPERAGGIDMLKFLASRPEALKEMQNMSKSRLEDASYAMEYAQTGGPLKFGKYDVYNPHTSPGTVEPGEPTNRQRPKFHSGKAK